jgi:pimeloyl-ACP methyl ester carboxylesterase
VKTRSVSTHHGRVLVLEGGSGPDLVYLHGGDGIAEDNPLLAKLAERYHVHAPLLPGYGESEEAPSIRDMLDVTLHNFDVIEALGLRRPLLVGHSLGGMIAAEMAAIAPHEVDRLVLISAAGLWLDQYPAPDLFSLMPWELPALLYHDEAAGRARMTRNVDMSDPKFLVPFLVTNARQMGMAGKFLFPIPERGLKERLYRVKARTVLVWGSADRIFPAPYAHAFKAAIAGAELVSVPDAGHMVTVEKPDAVMAAIGRLG